MSLTKLSGTLITDGAITSQKISASVDLGGPKIASISIANSTYHVLDDTAVNVGGGYIVITGTGFASGAEVIIGETPATSTTFVNSTTLRAQVPSANAATYTVYVVNTDGGSATKPRGLTYSGIPTWVTASTLANVSSNTAFTGSLSATGATSYAVASGSSLPTGMTLVTANGYYYGNISVGSDTTYNFTINAIDAENQDASRSFSLSAISYTGPTTVEYLVVAGGGGGGWVRGAGGGAGGYRTGTLAVSGGTPYTVTVGAGGTAGSNPSSPGAGGVNGHGANGSISVFSSITSAGGGGGKGAEGAGFIGFNGNSGGSGGGGAGQSGGGSGGIGNTPSVSPSQGNNGGSGADIGPRYGAGGGGGASTAGSDGTNSAGGNGGAGTTSSISGSSVTYAGGGGGSSFNGTDPSYVGTGGSGGGGNGGRATIPAENGTENRGGGGGGGSQAQNESTNYGAGGNGGSGIVIIRYADSFGLASSTTGSPTVTTSGGYRIYQWTGSGSITF